MRVRPMSDLVCRARLRHRTIRREDARLTLPSDSSSRAVVSSRAMTLADGVRVAKDVNDGALDGTYYGATTAVTDYLKERGTRQGQQVPYLERADIAKLRFREAIRSR